MDRSSILQKLTNKSFKLEEVEESISLFSVITSVVLDNLQIKCYYVFHYDDLEELSGIIYEQYKIGGQQLLHTKSDENWCFQIE